MYEDWEAVGNSEGQEAIEPKRKERARAMPPLVIFTWEIARVAWVYCWGAEAGRCGLWFECICVQRRCRGVGREGRGSYSCGANSWSCPGKQDQPGQVEGGEARGRDPAGGLRERLHKEVHLQTPRGGRASIRLWNQTFFSSVHDFPQVFRFNPFEYWLVALLIQLLEKHHLKAK